MCFIPGDAFTFLQRRALSSCPLIPAHRPETHAEQHLCPFPVRCPTCQRSYQPWCRFINHILIWHTSFWNKGWIGVSPQKNGMSYSWTVYLESICNFAPSTQQIFLCHVAKDDTILTLFNVSEKIFVRCLEQHRFFSFSFFFPPQLPSSLQCFTATNFASQAWKKLSARTCFQDQAILLLYLVHCTIHKLS